MFSEQGSLRTPSLLTPALTRTGSFSADSASRDTFSNAAGLDSQATKIVSDKPPIHLKAREELEQAVQDPDERYDDIETEEAAIEDTQATDEIELTKALEAAKAEMKMRQLPVESPTTLKLGSDLDVKSNGTHASSAFGWDATGGGDEADDWDADDLATLNSKKRNRVLLYPRRRLQNRPFKLIVLL